MRSYFKLGDDGVDFGGQLKEGQPVFVEFVPGEFVEVVFDG